MIVGVFLVPYLILKNIMERLASEFELSESSASIWSNIPGDRKISHLKELEFYRVSSKPYYMITNAHLHPLQTLKFNKQVKLADYKFNQTTMSANLHVNYTLNGDYRWEDQASKLVYQWRPAALRAVGEIERREPR